MATMIHFAILGYCGLNLYTSGMKVGESRSEGDGRYVATATRHVWGYEVVISFEGSEVVRWEFSHRT